MTSGLGDLGAFLQQLIKQSKGGVREREIALKF